MKRKSLVFGFWPKSRKRFKYCRTILIVFIFFIGIYNMINLPFKDKPGYDMYAGFISSQFNNFKNEIAVDMNSSKVYKIILEQGLPLISFERFQDENSPSNVFQSLLYKTLEFNAADLKTIINHEFSYIDKVSGGGSASGDISGFNEADVSIQNSLVEEQWKEYSEEILAREKTAENSHDNVEKEEETEASFAGQDNPLIGIYTTHNSETYFPSDGTRKVEGQNGGVSKAAEAMNTALEEEHNIPVVFSKEIHDYPKWSLSYSRSKETMKKMLSENPAIEIMVDIHRDAGFDQKSVVTIDGKEAARVLIIIGSDERLDHPNWEKNRKFAERVHQKMEELYPGLSKGTRVQSGRYNQHIHPKSILLEVGNVENTLEEAEYSAQLMSNVFKEILLEQKEDKL